MLPGERLEETRRTVAEGAGSRAHAGRHCGFRRGPMFLEPGQGLLKPVVQRHRWREPDQLTRQRIVAIAVRYVIPGASRGELDFGGISGQSINSRCQIDDSCRLTAANVDGGARCGLRSKNPQNAVDRIADEGEVACFFACAGDHKGLALESKGKEIWDDV